MTRHWSAAGVALLVLVANACGNADDDAREVTPTTASATTITPATTTTTTAATTAPTPAASTITTTGAASTTVAVSTLPVPTSAEPVVTEPGNTVTIEGFAFGPVEVRVPTGTRITWTNADGFAHTVDADDGSFSSGDLASDATFEHTFDAAGEFTYYCGIHPYMEGTVLVE